MKSTFFFWVCIIGTILSCNQKPKDRIVMDVEGFPVLVELNKNESFHYHKIINGDTLNKKITLLDYQLFKEANYWFDQEIGQENYYKAEVKIKVDDKDTVIYSRAYQMPAEVNGLSIGVETVKEWENHGNLEAVIIKDLKKSVRLAVSPAGAPHAPTDMRFPIENYIWHASSYYNTWNALVPYNHRYYHRGEDMAAIPDKLPVIAMFDGVIIDAPPPGGDNKSNGFMVKTKYDVLYRYGHINAETFMPGLDSGVNVRAGQQIGKTGEYWDGGKKQYSGPHLHSEFRYKDTRFNAFPAIMEAYFRDYSDEVVAIAGGYRFLTMGDSVRLDATRSLSRPGEQIRSYQWITHDGDTINNPVANITIHEPGLYSEQLLVWTNSGAYDRDFLQVRVYDPQRGKNIVNRHVMYDPVRNLQPGDSVLFWNRLNHTTAPVMIDFGDGTPPEEVEKEIYHQYNAPGQYVVTYTTTGPDHEPGTIQMEVKIN